jgi:hypothetical protein
MTKVLFRVLFLMLASAVVCSAQKTNNVLITANFNNDDIDAFVRVLEKQTSYKFYYDRQQFEFFAVTMSVKARPLAEVLENAFRYSGFTVSMDDEYHVFISKGLPIVTNLPKAGNTSKVDSLGIAQLLKAQANKGVKQSFANDKLYTIGINNPLSKEVKAPVSLIVVTNKTNTPVLTGELTLDGKPTSLVPDSSGMYLLNLPKGRHTLSVTAFGKKQAVRHIMVYAEGSLAIEMEDEIKVLEDVLVSTQRNNSVNRATMGMERLTIKSIKQVPAIFGEADVLRVILTLPGVQSVGEASTGFNVRGGGTDQNLILFNDATIYNPSHFFGFFSAFNPEIIKDVELYKSSIPAKFGGRLSSVLNITGREGNKQKFTGTAGVGLLTSRINIEGPIQKNKSSFILGARTTYAKWLLNLLPDDYENSAASFYDVNLSVAQKINDKNDLNLTGYLSGDKFRLNNDTSYGYQNKSLSVKWRHTFNSRLDFVLTGGYDGYSYYNKSEENKVNAYKMSFDINQLNLKTDFTYNINPGHAIDFGAGTISYKLHPGSFVPIGSGSLVAENISPAEQALESAVYVADRIDINRKLSINAGFRYSMFNYLGPQNVSRYTDGVPKDESSLVEQVAYGSGKIIKTYQGPEIRFSARYSVGKNTSLKAGYNTLRQYIHMLSNTTAISPTDIWKLSDYNIKPQYGDQVSLGLFKNFGKDSIETSIEVYYKRLQNILDYKSGAQLVLNPHIETDVFNARGKAYGVEMMIRKRTGKLNGWFSYTYSRTMLRMDDQQVGAIINNGKYYPSNYDKPHDATLVGNYAVNYRFSVSLNITYSTGRPITLPIGRYYYNGSQRALYSDRNAYRIPDYFRSDLSLNIEGNHKVHQLTHNSFTIGVYNLTGRRNPYSVYYTSENGMINGYKLSIFGNAIPFINYNIRF